MRIDHGMKVEAVGLRQALAKTPSIREPNVSLKLFTGSGIKEYANALKNAGKIANGLRIGGTFMIGLKFYDSGNTINNAREGGKDHFGHVATVESWKLAGDLAGGFGGAYVGLALVAAVGLTGGLALVVAGVAVAAGGFIGGYGGKIGGTKIGETVDKNIDFGIMGNIYEFME